MTANPAYRDLCSTCRNAMDCAFQKEPDKPVFHCEEFETEPFVSTQVTGTDPDPAVALPIPEDRDSGGYAGLCGDCEDRETCTFPRPDGGVWHCEEYR